MTSKIEISKTMASKREKCQIGCKSMLTSGMTMVKITSWVRKNQIRISVSIISIFSLLFYLCYLDPKMESEPILRSEQVNQIQVSGGNFDPNDGNFSNFPEISSKTA